MWWGKDIQLNTSHGDVRRQMFTSPIFGSGLQREPYTGCDPADKHVRNTTENQEENSRSVPALSFSPWYVTSLC